MDRAFWKGKRVLVTGHTGFKGSWLCLWLQELGAQVTGYALDPPTQPSHFELADVSLGMRSVLGDVRDAEGVRRVMAEAGPEIVFHMAAQPIVSVSYRQPVQTYATNVLGTVHVLEAIRQVGGVRVGVFITSDKCYENREWVWGYRESDPMGGNDPYSSSKGCAELAIGAYRRSYFSDSSNGGGALSLASVRAGNVIGGGDWAPDRLLPDCMRCVMEGRPIEIRRPEAVRPWQHVLEPLGGYLLLAERMWAFPGQYDEAWNFGPREADAWPVRRLVELLVRLWGEGASWKALSQQRFHEDRYLKLDCSKARARLAWQPRTDLKTALQWVVDWYKKYQAGADVKAVSLGQIKQFMSLGEA